MEGCRVRTNRSEVSLQVESNQNTSSSVFNTAQGQTAQPPNAFSINKEGGAVCNQPFERFIFFLATSFFLFFWFSRTLFFPTTNGSSNCSSAQLGTTPPPKPYFSEKIASLPCDWCNPGLKKEKKNTNKTRNRFDSPSLFSYVFFFFAFFFKSAQRPWNRLNGQPIRVLVTGAAGAIAYSLIFAIAGGDLFGPGQPIVLHLLDIPPMKEALRGVQMELQDCAFPLLKGEKLKKILFLFLFRLFLRVGKLILFVKDWS
jgi:hypothetical protein